MGGGYTISGCSGLSSANYSITYVNGTLTVTPAGLTATADPKSKVYGAGNPSLTYTITGFVNGDLASVVSGTAICTTTATLSSGVGGYPISCTQGSLSATNYNFSFVGGTLTVGPATLTVTANDKNREYGDSDPSFDATITGFKNGQTLTTSGVTGTASCSSTATMTSPVADYSITCTIGDLSSDNYSFTFALGTLHVTQAVLVVTANDKTRQYGDANPGFDATITGFKNGEKLASSGVRGSPACFTSATPASPVHDGPYAIHCVTGSLAAHNYSFSFINGWLTVTPAPLVITADDKTKPYGAELPVLTVTYSGFVNGEDAGSLTTEPAIATSATVSSHVAGSPYSIGASGAVDTNYTFSYAAGTLSVTPVTLTITANNQTKAYGAALPALTVSYLGLVNGDTSATFSSAPNTAPAITTTAHADSHVAGNPYSITASRAADSDYTISYVAGTLTVTPVWLTITADDQTKAYGAALPALTASYAGFTNGDAAASLTAPPTLSTPATAASHVAGNPFLITATGAVDSDYTISYVDGTLTVTPVTLTITAESKVKAYGAELPALTASYSGFVNGDTPASLTTPPTLTANATSASHVAGSPYPITAAGAFDTDYTISYVAGALTVTPVALTITAGNKTKPYGAVLPELTASYAGFVNGDTSDALTDQPTISTTASQSSHRGTYPIKASGAVDGDYTISYVDGTLTVTPVVLTITADDQTKAYGAALPSLTASYAGFTNGDTAASLTTAPALSTTATAASHVAGNPFSITAAGAVDNDYTISYVDGTLTVTPVTLTITADSKVKAYGAALPALIASYSGFVNGDTPASLTTLPTLTANATSASHVADRPYSITVSGAFDTDYTISYVAGTLTVTPVGLTITADNKTKAYGAAPVLTASYSGFVNGEAPGSLTTLPTLSTTATASSHVSGSPYAITAAGAVDADYTISYVTGALTVTPVGLTITADSKNKAYGAALPALTASYAGLVNGDTPASLATAPMLTTTATAASHVAGNPYSITVSAAVDTDYTISYVPGTLTVTPAPLTITAQNKTMVLNAAALPVFTVSYNAFVNGDTPASLTAQPSISTNATTASPIGTYSITASAAVDSDYAITYAPGTLSVVFASSTTSCGGVVGRTVLQPVNPDSSSVFKAGSTVPIKFRVCDANGNPVGGAVSVVKVGIDGHADPIVYNTVSNVGPVDETVVSTTPDADFRWDASGQQFIFNMNTKNLKVGVHYFYRIDLIDGTSIYYDFGVK